MRDKNIIRQMTDIWGNDWFLLTSGDFMSGDFNAMTVAWGSIGTMWSKPFAQVVVRPSRYTYKYMNRFDTFTLCSFPHKYRKSLSYLGAVSGRSEPNKIESAGLTPIACDHVDAPGYEEADRIIECRKIYWQDMDEHHFLIPGLVNKYPGETDFHRIYFGEILNIVENQ